MRGAWWWLWPVVAGGLSFGFLAVVLLLPDRHWDAKVRACDGAVHALLSTHDAVEFDRARFIVRRFNCDIGRRLPEAG